MGCGTITYEEFTMEVRKFVEISDRLCDGWKLYENENNPYSMYLKKESLIETEGQNGTYYLKAEYVISYSVSYCVPLFAFNLWNSSGVLMSLKEIREFASVEISEKDFYSVISQQEHPVLFRPLFVVHPCHTGPLLDTFKKESNNLKKEVGKSVASVPSVFIELLLTF